MSETQNSCLSIRGQLSRKWRASHPNYDKEWRDRHREDIRLKDKRYYAKNRQRIIERQKAYYRRKKKSEG